MYVFEFGNPENPWTEEQIEEFMEYAENEDFAP